MKQLQPRIRKLWACGPICSVWTCEFRLPCTVFPCQAEGLPAAGEHPHQTILSRITSRPQHPLLWGDSGCLSGACLSHHFSAHQFWSSDSFDYGVSQSASGRELKWLKCVASLSACGPWILWLGQCFWKWSGPPLTTKRLNLPTCPELTWLPGNHFGAHFLPFWWDFSSRVFLGIQEGPFGQSVRIGAGYLYPVYTPREQSLNPPGGSICLRS